MRIATGGELQGTVDAGRSVAVFALDDVQQSVTAGEDALVGTLGNVSGSVDAGRDALVTAAGDLSSPVTAGRHAFVSTIGNVNGNVTATQGDALLITFGTVNSTLSAGEDALLLGLGVGDNVTADVNAGNDAFIQTAGWTQLTLDAPNDAFVFTTGDALTGSVTAGRHAAVVSLGNQTQLQLDAGLDAFLFSFGSLDMTANAGRDIAVIGLDDVKGSVDATSDAFVYALGTVTSLQLSAGDFAGLVSWDTVQGPSAISGDDGAFVWTYQNFYGDVTSSAGPAALSSYGDVFLSSVTAATDAVVTVVGDFYLDSSVSAGEGAYIVSLGDFEGTVNAAADAVLLGEGTFNVTLDAGKDVFVYSLGDVQGSYAAGRDASVITFGSFHGRVHAGRDVGGERFGLQQPGVWAKGDITGVIDANRNVGGHHSETVALFDGTRFPVIFAGGNIDADIYARNTSQQENGGRVGKIAAHGGITGRVIAREEIEALFASDEIDAILNAPTIGTVSENDPSVQTDYPLPETPASIKADVQAEADAAHAAVIDEQTAIAIARGELDDVFAELEADLQDDVATSRAEIQLANAQALAAAAEALDTAEQTAAEAFEKLRKDAEDGRGKEQLSRAKEAEKQFTEQLTEAERQHVQQQTQTEQAKTQHVNKLARSQEAIDQQQQQALAAAGRLDDARKKAWEEHGQSLTERAEEIREQQRRLQAEFERRLKETKEDLQSDLPGRRQAAWASLLKLEMHGKEWWLQRQFEVEANMKLAEGLILTLGSLIPGVGHLFALYELGHGKDVFGNPVPPGQQFLNILSLGLPVAAVGPKAIRAAKTLSRFGKTVTKTAKGADRAGDIFGTAKLATRTNKLDDVAGFPRVPRKLDDAAALGKTSRTQNFFGHGETVTPPVVTRFKSTQTWNTGENARILRRNMKSKAERVHHIVPSTHPNAQRARNLLDKYEIDINDAANGVGLTKAQHQGSGLHKHDNIDAVTRRLEEAVEGIDDWATGRQAIIDELAAIRLGILNGTFP